MSKIREMGSKALQSLWVQRLRPSGDFHALNTRELEPRWVAEEEEDDIEMEEKTRYVILPRLLPKVEIENVLDRPLANINTNTAESTDLVTETQVIASFGPFNVRTRSVIPLKRSDSYVKKSFGMDTYRPAILPLPDDNWKQYSHGREKEENRLRMGTIDQDRQGFTSGLLASTSMGTSYCKPMRNDYRNKHPTLDCHCDHTQHKLSKFQWNKPQQQKSENSKWNPGFCKEIVPSSGGKFGRSNQKRDWADFKRPEMPFGSENLNPSIGFPQRATPSVRPSVCPEFRIVKQMQIPENPSDIECASREQLPETSNLQPLLGGHRYGIEQQPRGFDTIGRYPFENDIFRSPNYPGFAKQKDKTMPPPKSGSTASFPNDVYGGFRDRTNDRNKLNMFGFYPGRGTSLKESNVNNCRPLRERGYLDPDMHSFHNSNFPGLDQGNSSRDQNRDTRFLKQSDIPKDGWLNVKGKASNLEKTAREQRHEKEFARDHTGCAYHYTSYDDAINLAIQAQPVSVRISAREEQIGRERDESVKENLKDDKISTMVHGVLSGKEYPRDNIDFNACKTTLEGHEFHQFKSRKQSAEEGPTIQRLRKLCDEREAEVDCGKHVRLKISSADGQASISGKRTCCLNKELVQIDAPIVNNIATTSESNAVKASRPEMWLQRWIQSSENTDLVSGCEVSENLNCNPLKAHGSLVRTCTQEWSGDNGQKDFIQWKNNRKDNYKSFSDARPQTWGDGHFKSDLKGSPFMKTFLTSSASAMAIIGTRAKEMYAAQSLRNEILPVWTSTRCADADAKATGPEKEIATPDELELKPKKTLKQEIVEHKDIQI